MIYSVIRKAREKKYRTALEFWRTHEDDLEVSYPHYSAIETGRKFPKITFAIKLAGFLNLDLRSVCHLWAKEQMPSPETAAFFDPAPGRVTLEKRSTPFLDQYSIVREVDAKALESSRYAWEVFSLLTASTNERCTPNSISNELSISRREVDIALETLAKTELVDVLPNRIQARRSYAYVPDSSHFDGLRNNNFRRACERILTGVKYGASRTFRTVFIRKLTLDQAKEARSLLMDALSQIGAFESRGADLHTCAVGLSPLSPPGNQGKPQADSSLE